MKTNLVAFIFILFAHHSSTSQAWMTDLDIAQKLASVQNKMVLMVWEECTTYKYPVLVIDQNYSTILIDNLFEDEDISPLIWKYFIPVIVSENQYADLFAKLKGKYSKRYIDKFNDNSIKIMDINGNILNVNYAGEGDYYQNITTLVRHYSINTSMISRELLSYKSKKNFYSAYYLASKYLDLALYSIERTRPAIIDLSNIYLKHAIGFLQTNTGEENARLLRRCDLLKIQEFLILKRPKKVIRALKKLKTETIESANQSFVAFLYYASYMSLEDTEKAEMWKSKISTVDMRKAILLINLNLR